MMASSGFGYLVRISIGFVVLLGVAFTALMLFYATAPYTEKDVIPVSRSAIGDTLIFGSIAIGSLAVCIGLAKRKLWAWWTTVLFCALLLVAGIFLFWTTLHPRDEFARSEGGFGWFLGSIFSSLGGACLSILNSSGVRRSFISQNLIVSPQISSRS